MKQKSYSTDLKDEQGDPNLRDCILPNPFDIVLLEENCNGRLAYDI